MAQELKRNRLQCLKCKDIIESYHRHDYKHCKCGSIMIDGGLAYGRYGWPGGDRHEWIKELYEYETELPKVAEETNADSIRNEGV